jgi:aspartate kinase
VGDMSVIVQKYGGSSVADLDKIRRVARRVATSHEQGNRVVVVVSAMGNTTNELIALAHDLTKDPDRRELDMLVSVGERVSMALLAMALRDCGVRARSLTGSQSGIITDESHANAQVLEVRPARIQRCLEEGNVVIVAGFQGVSREREVTTLGRGGSDTTAVVLAAALEAEYCEICSDVDGVWSADPRVVPEAVKLDTLSLDEALALSRAGAKVLFEDAVAYAKASGVTMVAASTFGPGAGTRLSPIQVTRERPLAVSGDAQLIRCELDNHESARSLEPLAAAGARLRRRLNRSVWLDTRNVHGALPEGLEHTATAIATIVGQGIGEEWRFGTEGTAVLEAAGLRVHAFASAGDELWWEVDPESLTVAVQTLHKHFVEQ